MDSKENVDISSKYFINIKRTMEYSEIDEYNVFKRAKIIIKNLLLNKKINARCKKTIKNFEFNMIKNNNKRLKNRNKLEKYKKNKKVIKNNIFLVSQHKFQKGRE